MTIYMVFIHIWRKFVTCDINHITLSRWRFKARHDEIPSLHGLCPHETERINMSNFLLYIVKTDISYAQHEYIYGIYLC